MKKTLIVLIILVAIAGGAYWYFFMRSGTTGDEVIATSGNTFNPIPRNTRSNVPTNTVTTSTTSNDLPIANNVASKPPKLRLLSNTPVGGYGASSTVVTIPLVASSTASTTAKNAPKTTTKAVTVVRWVDRGRGNIFQAVDDSLDITTLSNTVLPRVYASVWNKNLTAFIGSIFKDDLTASTLYSEIRVQSTSTQTKIASTTVASQNNNLPLTPYLLKGKNLPDNIIGYAVSPKGDKLFTLTNESGTTIGYISNFDGGSATKIFESPMTQINVEWPEDNIIAISTKGNSNIDGYLYFVNPKTGSQKKIAGPLKGMSAKVSHDGKYALVSATNNDGSISVNIRNIGKNSSADAVIKTLADKCVWGNFYREIVYCAVPSQQIEGSYPEDWYKGQVSFTDKIWQINAETGEIHLLSAIVDQSDRVVDAFNLGLDQNDNYLYFMNKNDLSLWSLDLVSN